ncbi:hypothetical protein [Chelatococcus sp. XZ-Ab1]|uniref:hypothetical protein n=1 Tax=Chelatococcus sp. XZ-Ab1 TaxID=3034027 RepID=UPI0023E37512|nr:hypothetical protein [Chelatococcus sp. XZ-Ab1]
MQNTLTASTSEEMVKTILQLESDRGPAVAREFAEGCLYGALGYLVVRLGSRSAYDIIQAAADAVVSRHIEEHGEHQHER